jgi:hypothetical protein
MAANKRLSGNAAVAPYSTYATNPPESDLNFQVTDLVL